MKQILSSLFILLLLCTSVIAQDRTVTGTIKGKDDGLPLPGVSVRVKGTAAGTQSGANGQFTLTVPGNNAVLVFTYIGYSTQEVNVGSRSVVNVSLGSDATQLGEVVVTANSIRREKRTLGYSAPTVNADELTEGRNASALNALTGKVAGVNITSTSNTPGSSSRVVLRGGSSISGNNQALIVVDGVPIDNSSVIGGASSLASVDFGNRGNDINPDDIASMTVLKGPAAAALYGSRASNGALIITTKSGNKAAEKTQVTFNTANTFSSILKLPQFQNEYGQGYFSQDFDDNGEPIFTLDPLENWSWGPKFTGEVQEWGQEINGVRLTKPFSAQPDAVRNFFDTGFGTDNNLSFSGGGEKTSFYLGLNSLNSDGTYPGKSDVYNRYGVRFNGTAELSNNITAGVNFNYSKIDAKQVGGGQGGGSVYNNLLQTPRDIPVDKLGDLSNPYYGYGYTDNNGVRHDNQYGYYGAYSKNPYWLLENFENANTVNRVTGNFNITYKPLSWLTLQERLGVDSYTDRRRLMSPKYSFVPADVTSGNYRPTNSLTAAGEYEIDQYNVNEVVHDFMVTATHKFNEDFEGSLMLGNNIRQRNSTTNKTATNASGGLVVPGWYNLSNSNGPINVISDLISERRLVGVYADLNLAYKNMLFFEATARNDWSSTLPKSNNSFFYPSVSGSFVFTELLKNSTFTETLNYGKVRMNWAQVGSDTDPYQLVTSYNKADIPAAFGGTTFPFGSVAALMAGTTLGNLDLKPEITTSFEVGTELGFFNNRFTADFSYYANNSKDQILSIPIPNSTGYGFRLINAGKVENKGVELALRGTPIRTSYGLSWELYGTYTKNKNKVIELLEGVEQVSLGGFSGMSIVAAKGRPYGEFYGVTEATDDQGRTIVDSETGIPVLTSSAQYLGSYNPDFQASLGTSIRYKNWAVNALFDTKQGGKFYSRTKDILAFVGTSRETGGQRVGGIIPNSVYLDDDGNSVVNTDVTYVAEEYYPYRSDGKSVIDASFVKLRTLGLSYAFTREQLRKTPFGALSIGLFGNNLFIWTSGENQFADPEINSAGAGNAQGFDFTAQPSVRNYGFNVKVSF